MLESPLRNEASVDRASLVFNVFSKNARLVLRHLDHYTYFCAATIAFGATFCIETQRRDGTPVGVYFDAVSTTGLIAILTLMLLINIPTSIPSASWNQLTVSQIALSLLPFYSWSAKLGDLAKAANSPIEALGLVSSSCRVHFRSRILIQWRRFELSLYSIVVPMLLVTLLFIIAACSLAAYPAGTPESRLSFLFQGYTIIASTTQYYKFDKLNRRGKLHPLSQIPTWPVMAFPSPLNLIGLCLMTLRAPSHKNLCSESFYGRHVVPQYRWEFLREKLPRCNTGDLRSTEKGMEIQSFFRSKLAILSFQLFVIGTLSPITFPHIGVDSGAGLCAVLLLITGSVLTNFKSQKGRSQQKQTFSILAWALATVGAALYGLILGSAVGRAQMEMAGLHMTIFGLIGLTFLGILLICFSRKITHWWRALIWVPIMPIAGAFGTLASTVPPFRPLLEQILLTLGVFCLLIELPSSLYYQHLFLEPFTIRDVWRRDLPPATKKQLLPIALALVMPLGGLANALLAAASLRRDRMLRLWWESRRGETWPVAKQET